MDEGGVSRGDIRVMGFAGDEMDFQLLRSLGAAVYGGAAPGEVFAARAEIADGDPASWSRAFAALADRTAAGGASAAGTQLRAAMYYRAAEYYAAPGGPEGRRLGHASRDAFVAAMRGAPLTAQRVTLSGAPALSGWWLEPVGGARPDAPWLVAISGFDGTPEEVYFHIGAAAVARGYAVLMVEGPGQAGVRRDVPDSAFVPDYTDVLSAWIAEGRARGAAGPVALYGLSFGGYFAPTAVLGGATVDALVVNSPIIDLRDYMAAFIGPELVADPPDLALSDLDEIPDGAMPPLVKHGLRNACLRFGVNDFRALVRRLGDFRLERLDRIACPVLALYGEEEGPETLAQAEAFAAGVAGVADLRVFRAAEGAGGHCQFGNLDLSAQVVLDWIAARLGPAAP